MVAKIINIVGKHKIPRFLYHMTTKANYEKIVSDNFLRGSKQYGTFNGSSHVDSAYDCVFLIELTNFFKRWRKSNDWSFDTLQKALIEQVAKGKDEIVILKIPTFNLNPANIFIRSQNELFCKSSTNRQNFVSAKMSSLYKQRKHAIEYMYSGLIGTSGIEKIGELSIKTLKESAEYDHTRPIRSLFINLLKGTPEVKGAELLTY